VNGDSGVIRVAPGLLRELAARARAALPRECCGLLVGAGGHIDECVETANVDPHPSRYQVDPAAHIELNRRLRGTGRAIVGVYHSHPRGRAVPSPTDVAEAFYPDFVHVIVAVASDTGPEIRAYAIDGAVVREVAIVEDSG
jgi:proteasome lid subunit RPN8/RPN11